MLWWYLSCTRAEFCRRTAFGNYACLALVCEPTRPDSSAATRTGVTNSQYVYCSSTHVVEREGTYGPLVSGDWGRLCAVIPHPGRLPSIAFISMTTTLSILRPISQWAKVRCAASGIARSWRWPGLAWMRMPCCGLYSGGQGALCPMEGLSGRCSYSLVEGHTA